MLRKFSPTLFNSAATRQVCLKQCGINNPKPMPDEIERNVRALTDPMSAKLMVRILSTNDGFKKTMFPRIFKISHEEVTDYLIKKNLPSLLAIIQQAEDIDTLINQFPKSQRTSLKRALCTDWSSLINLLQPLSRKNQLQLLDFIGMERIIDLHYKELSKPIKSYELLFFMVSESLNFSLKRKNHNYLYVMREREEKPTLDTLAINL